MTLGLPIVYDINFGWYFYFFIDDFNSVHDPLSYHTSNAGTFDGILDDEVHLHDVGRSSAIYIPPNVRNVVFDVISVMLHIL